MRQTVGKILTGLLVLALSVTFLSNGVANAAELTSRKLTLVAGATDGGSKPSGVVNHQFTFTVPTGGNVGSIRFEYCTTASGTCTTPTGLSTTSATLGSESGITGFTVNNTTQGAPYVTRTAANVTASTTAVIQLNSITNPSTEGTFFVRINTYTAAALGGTVTDTGTVAASTAEQIILTGTMPESLIFCAGAKVSTTSSIPDCSTATSGAVSFNQLFSPTDTAVAYSQMAASTNAGTGYVITVNGPTMTSGANTIPAMSSATTSTKGVGQFGMNLKANTSSAASTFPGSSAEIAPASDGVDFRGQATAGYNTVDTFKFVSGDTVANSANGGAGPTNSQIYTASYIVNVAGNQLAGTYTSTLTYICTPTF